MKNFRLISVIFFALLFSAAAISEPVLVYQMNGNRRIEQMGPNSFRVYCDPPKDVHCLKLTLHSNGTWTITSADGSSEIPIEGDFEITDDGGVIYTESNN